jgi:P-type Ca2+ transporter type 2C
MPAVGAPVQGLSSGEAAARLARDGANELQRREITPRWRVFLGQFANPLILLLLGSAGVAAFVGALLDALAIATIVSINAVVGYNQEYRAEKAVLALRSMTASRARVVRDGRVVDLPAADVVMGDLLALEAGDVVAADARLVEAHDFSTVEASLTGESTPVEKSIDPVSPGTPLAERTNDVFMGTSVATGAGRAVVRQVGMSTEMGKIAGALTGPMDAITPLQRRLAHLSRVLLYVCLVLVAAVAGIGALRGQEALDVLLTAVSLAVAAVPEGLPAVVTVALAVGVRRMSDRNVLVRRLSAVETLGSATVICTDKTGTLTTGVMTLRETWGPSKRDLLHAAAACCDAELGAEGDGGVGDPTELAILRGAAEEGIRRPDIEAEEPRVEVHPFDARRRMMSILREGGRLYVKGALEALLPIVVEGADGAEAEADRMAARGLRVLAVAVGEEGEPDRLRLLGLLGIADAPRPEARRAIAQARSAGIKVVMITGDHPATAQAIAKEMGIIGDGRPGDDVVFARRTAADKTDIVRKLRERGEIVAMTGDGVNDAPSIREADIGIAMGQTATEVTREASEMILTTDDLGGVVEAIREGRVIYANIRKTIVYLLGGNAAELLFMLVAAAVGWPMPLTPIQLLWINMLGEPLPGLALAVDPAESDVLDHPPHSPAEPIMGRRQWGQVAFAATLHTIIVLGAFGWALQAYGLPIARTLAFTTFVFGVLLRAFAARSPNRIFWEVGALGNLKLLWIVLASFGLQLAIVYLPWTPGIFGVVALPVDVLAIAAILGLVPVSVIEITKLLRRGLGQGRSGTTSTGHSA